MTQTPFPVDPAPAHDELDGAIILHIPKTAGTSFRHVALRNYAPKQVFLHYPASANHSRLEDIWRLPLQELQNLKLLMGHFSSSAIDFAPRTFARIAMMREPVARIVSRYRHTLRHDPRWSSLEPRPTLAEFLRKQRIEELDNGQTRYLAGAKLAYGACSAETLDQAIRQVDRGMTFVGLSERFDESLAVICKLLAWKHLDYQHLNAAPEPPSPLSDEELSLLEPLTAFDRHLYRHVAGKFDSLLGELHISSQPSAWSSLRGKWKSWHPASLAVDKLRSFLLHRHVLADMGARPEPSSCIISMKIDGPEFRGSVSPMPGPVTTAACFRGTARIVEAAVAPDGSFAFDLSALHGRSKHPSYVVIRDPDHRVLGVAPLSLDGR